MLKFYLAVRNFASQFFASLLFIVAIGVFAAAATLTALHYAAIQLPSLSPFMLNALSFAVAAALVGWIISGTNRRTVMDVSHFRLGIALFLLLLAGTSINSHEATIGMLHFMGT